MTNHIQPTVDALVKAEAALESIRLILVNHLEEPERSAFWKAVTARDAIRATLAAPVETEEDWRDDPSADERWNAGLDYAMVRFCQCLGVDPKSVRWDAATEELDGDVCAVIGNILRAKFGEDFDPDVVPRLSAGTASARDGIAAIISDQSHIGVDGYIGNADDVADAILKSFPVLGEPQAAQVPTREQIAQAFETIRMKLVNCLEEPELSAFWLAVQMRDALSKTEDL